MINKGFVACSVAWMLMLSSCASMTGNDANVVDGLTQPLASQQEYVVKKGDTLYSIAFAADKDYRVLAFINRLPAPFIIHVADVLMLESHAKITLPEPSRSEKVQIALLEPMIITVPVKPTKHKTPVKTKKLASIANHHIKKSSQVKKNTKVSHKLADNNIRRRNVKHSKIHKKVKRNLTGHVNQQLVNHWLWPAKGKVVGTFSLERVGNRGLDIRGKYGSPIRATAPGTVVYSGSGLRGYGNLIIIKHNARYLSAYAYNKKLLVGQGAKVKSGQQIATMGRSDSGSVKLHFEIRRAGKPVDPKKYLG